MHYDNYNLHCVEISIHALLAESDALRQLQFALCRNFYPRSPCGERPFEKFEGIIATKISIHALLAESDVRGQRPSWGGCLFLSTLSLRRATALRQLQFALCRNFYPRSPCGERLRGWTLNINGPIFLSTLSLRRATDTYVVMEATKVISIHALLAESDAICLTVQHPGIQFLSTLSLRRATLC